MQVMGADAKVLLVDTFVGRREAEHQGQVSSQHRREDVPLVQVVSLPRGTLCRSVH
jgi:hypothetical protein